MSDQELSKYLSWILRHRPDAVGLVLDDAGWVDIDMLLTACATHGRPLGRDQLEALVRASDKQRFAIDAAGQRIRANQGHSLPIDLQLQPAEPPAELYHGTVARFLASIRKTGLQRGQRHHVHLAADRATAERVGARRGDAVILRVAAARMQADGHRFWRSANGVWLVDAVPPAYLAEEP